MSIQHDKTYRQTYRVADSVQDRYELYVGEDQMPDFDASDQPVATSSSLPFNYTPDSADSGQTKVLYCVVRKRNRFGLLSHNQHPTLVEIDDQGEEVLGPLSTPEIIRVVDRDSGEIVVHARYPLGDRDPADTWDVYVKTGSAPDPDVDDPVATADVGLPGVDYILSQAIDGLTPGSTVYVVVVVRRDSESGDGRIGESTATAHTLAITVDIDEEQTLMHGGS